MKTKTMKALSANELRNVNGGCSNCQMNKLFKGIYGENNPFFPTDDTCHTDMGKNFSNHI